MAGIYIKRGMSLEIPAGGFSLSMDDDGSIKSNLTVHVWFDVCPTWLELSLRHLDSAIQACENRKTAWAGTDEDSKASTLEREFESSMQAIMAAAIALDAFYSTLQMHVVLPPTLVQGWRDGRTARASQVTEVIRRAFGLNPKGTTALQATLKEIYRVRDLAVHPSGKLQAPIFHRELNVAVEWRFAYFSAANAKLVVDGVTWILWNLCHKKILKIIN